MTAAATRFYEMYNTQNIDMLDELFAPGYVGNINGREIIGVDAAKATVTSFLAAFPDAHYTVEDMIASGDRVVTRWTATATQRGPFAGVAPTNRRVTMRGITILQITGTQISALWNTWDMFGLIEQLREST